MSFNDIRGHDNIKRFFKQALSQGRVGHSYLFFGPDGVGKSLFGATLAGALNCFKLRDDSCDTCPSCAKIKNRTHPDVAWLELAQKKDSISIEQIRAMCYQVNLKPYEGRTKVFIIAQADLMSEAAANCLLKTLEEPPQNSVIILITSRPEHILPTVRSRCIQIKFERLGLKARVELARSAGLSDEDSLFLSRLGGADAAPLSVSKGAGLLEYKNRVVDEFRSAGAMLDENSFIFGLSKTEMKFAVLILASWFRDVAVLKAAAPSALVVNSDRIGELEAERDRFSFGELEDVLMGIADAGFSIERNVGPKLAFNDLKIKLSGKAREKNE
ncbi:MAG: DNA polymerase III subunit delta' [Candidatus Omnitrophica bacterium]|nr:DNA polymerase III subunit delta' [Candidatus Omnitrophota bacterium]